MLIDDVPFDAFHPEAAHELNNLLGVILTHASFVARRVHQDPVAAADVEAISTAAQQAVALTRRDRRPNLPDRTEAPAQPADDRQGAGRLILVADDSSAFRDLTTRILTGNGYRVLAAADAAAALGFLKDGHVHVDLLLTDAVMPGMSGAELVAAARKRWPEVPALLMSGDVDRTVGGQGESCTATTPLGKPFTQGELLEAVRRALEKEAGS